MVAKRISLQFNIVLENYHSKGKSRAYYHYSFKVLASSKNRRIPIMILPKKIVKPARNPRIMLHLGNQSSYRSKGSSVNEERTCDLVVDDQGRLGV